jgi:hypothetical protein
VEPCSRQFCNGYAAIFRYAALRFRAFFHIHEVKGVRKGNKGPGVTDFVTQFGAFMRTRQG